MSVVTINLLGRKFNLVCPEQNRAELVRLSELLDSCMIEVRAANPAASFELSLVMAALRVVSEKENQTKQAGGEVLVNANKLFQNTLSSIFSELQHIEQKIDGRL